MSEMEMKTEVETEEFTDELSDEALDRAEGGYWCQPPGDALRLSAVLPR